MSHGFTASITRKLKHYVYLYSTPDGEVFYVGKGKANRAFAHLKKGNVAVSKKIRTLRRSGKEPHIEILKYGLNESEALLVESTAIDLLDIKNLLNSVKGHGSRHGARASVAELVHTLAEKKANIVEPSVLINVAKRYHHSLSPIDIYDATRCAWIVNIKKVRKAKYAFCVHQRIIREVYRIVDWFIWDSTMHGEDTRGGRRPKNRRWEFVGRLAEEPIRKKYIGRSVSHLITQGAQNPIMYLNLA